MRSTLRYIFYSILGFIIALLILPFAFRYKLIEEVKKKANEEINAKIDFETIQISLIRQFPSVSLDVYLLKLDGINEFQGVRLLSSDKVSIKTDWKSLIKPSKGIAINELRFEAPELNLIVHSDSVNNYSIVKESEESSKDFFGTIKEYSINNGTIRYLDRESSINLSMDSVFHEGHGDFTSKHFELNTSTDIARIDLFYQGVPFLKSAVAKASMLMDIDMEASKYSFKENLMSLNALEFSLNGSIQSIEDNWDLDLAFESKNNAVSSLISIIPEMYSSDFENLTSRGSGHIEANTIGIYDAQKGIFPSIDLDISLNNGFIQYPDLPYPLQDIQSHLLITADEGNWDDLIIDLKQFNFFLDGKPFGSKFKITEPFSDPHISANVLGSIDLNSLAGFLPQEKTFFNSGLVDADIKLDVYQSDIINKNYSDIDCNGYLKANDLSWSQNGLESRMQSLNTTFSPSIINVDISDLQLGRSDLNGTIKIKDPLSLLTNNDKSETKLLIESSMIDLDQINQIMVQAESNESDVGLTPAVPKWNLEFTGKQIKYTGYDIRELKLSAEYEKENLRLSNASVILNNDPLRIRGNIAKIISFLNNQDTLQAELFLDAENFNLNSLSSSGDTATDTDNIIIPDDISLQLDANIEKLQYNELIFNNIDARLVSKDAILDLMNARADLLGGRAVFEGQYNCQDPKKPTFNFRYDLASLTFQKLFQSSELFRNLAPLAEYIDGKFNSSLVISGPLGDQMAPILNELDASGFFETFGAQFSDLPLLNKVTTNLGLSNIQEWYIKDSRNWFEIYDGRIDLKKRDYEVEDLSFSVDGSYDLNHNMDLSVLASIPRKKITTSNINSKIDSGLSFLQNEASKLGINLDIGSHIYLDIGIKGKINDANIKIKPVGSGGESIKPQVQTQIESGKELLKDTISKRIQEEKERISDSVLVKKDQLSDTILNKAGSSIDSLKDKAGQIILQKIDSSLINTKIDSTLIKGTGVGDLIDKAKQSEIDSIKSKLNSWNPFKKKKKK